MQLSKLLQRRRRIRKQKQTCTRIFLDENRTVMYTIINPMWINVKGNGNLRNRQCPLNAPGVRLRARMRIADV
jgi:hypothetical protein